ncbi:MAG: YXWGXW repeat-containing protein [Theionarchaea archaeon]|nr:YXWGXW repeat-containing protein [Theionarchaea archaeon]
MLWSYWLWVPDYWFYTNTSSNQ